MSSSENPVKTACFNIATHLMWEKELTPEDIEPHMVELGEMTEKLEEIAVFHIGQVTEYDDGQEVVIRAINYMNEALVIPPLRGNYSWFEHTLAVLVELARPVAGLSEETLPFLEDLEMGMEIYRGDAENREAEDE